SACGTAWDEQAGSWNQKMFPEDYLSFQFQVTPYENALNLIVNPSFADGGSGWDVELDLATFTPLGVRLFTDGIDIRVNYSLNSNQYYLVTVSGYLLSDNDLPISMSLTNVSEDVNFFISQEGGESYSFYVQSTTGKIGIKRNANEGDIIPNTSIVLEYVTAMPIELPSISIIDLAGANIELITNATYEPPYLNVLYKPSNEVVNVGIFQIKVTYACDEAEVVTYISEAIQIIPADNCFIQ